MIIEDPSESGAESQAPTLSLFARVENGIARFILGLMVILASFNALGRAFLHEEIPGAGVYVQHLNLALALAGAVVAARSGRHLTLSTGHTLGHGLLARIARSSADFVAGFVSLVLAVASFDMAMMQRGSPTMLPGGIPDWAFQMVMPIGFGLMALRFFFHRTSIRRGLLLIVAAAVLIYSLRFIPEDDRSWMTLPFFSFLVLSSFLGTPIFILMAGSALLFFFVEDVSIAAVPIETYHIVVSPTLPVIPLFTFAGYLLAKGGASGRLIRLFDAWFGWMPGGVAIVTALVCAFFTTFTGASGVTILGMGGLLLPMLLKGGYTERFSLGLLTTSGSLGMLFPPSLPVILYGVMAGVAIDKLFLAGIVPGFLMMGLVAAFGILRGVRDEVPRSRFRPGEAWKAVWEARYEILLPILLFSGLFGIPGVMAGFLNLGEAAALVAVYILFVECVLTRDLKLSRDVPAVMLESSTVIGALLIIFGAALGMTNYLVDAEIPGTLADWVKTHIESRWLFLLVLNGVLLVVGSLMEGFSAIVILVPLITPIAAAFQIHPVHLGILFLANLEVGFLLPPVGLNLFLSSLRFRKPLSSMYRPILPFLVLMAFAVLVISYVPSLSLWAIGEIGAPPVDPASEFGK